MESRNMLDLTHDELQALQARIPRPLAQADPAEAGLSPEMQTYRIQENHYRSAVEKIERAIDSPTRRQQALDDLPPILQELVESRELSLYFATKVYREADRDENKACQLLAQFSERRTAKGSRVNP
jgi:hypothetical protein